jgi:4-hydroxybenzoate polyprenyltransferase
LPYNEPLLDFLRSEHCRGRRVVLATAADSRIAHSVAAHVGIFDEVLASNARINLGGGNKSRALVERFGHDGFDYIGDSTTDLPIFAVSRSAWIAGRHSASLSRRAKRARCSVEGVFAAPKPGFKTWVRALRVHQWSKNALIFLPLVTSHRLFDPAALLPAILAALAFSLCASGVYIFNDLCDLESDRKNSRKRTRPFASGALPIIYGYFHSPLLFAAGLALAAALPRRFLQLILLYSVATLAYTLWIKRLLLVDALMLAGLYTIRVLAGGAASGIDISPWLLDFSLFIFLSLGMLKRVSELRVTGAAAQKILNGRAYVGSDRQILLMLGAASGYVAALVLGLYIDSSNTTILYRDPQWLWFLCPLEIYWISRLWVIEERGRMQIDPVLFAVTDKVSYLVALLAAVCILLAA